jgi:anti-sigma factor RsiW
MTDLSDFKRVEYEPLLAERDRLRAEVERAEADAERLADALRPFLDIGPSADVLGEADEALRQHEERQ